MAIEQLGLDYDVVPTASGVLLSLRYVAGVTFVLTGEDTYTLRSATTYDDGSPSTLADFAHYYTNASAAGADQWADASQNAADTITLSGGCAAVFVDAADLPAGAIWVSCTAGGSGLVTAILGKLPVMRDPSLLPVRSGSGS